MQPALDMEASHILVGASQSCQWDFRGNLPPLRCCNFWKSREKTAPCQASATLSSRGQIIDPKKLIEWFHSPPPILAIPEGLHRSMWPDGRGLKGSNGFAQGRIFSELTKWKTARVKQGHGPGEAFREGSYGRQPRTRGSPLIGRASSSCKRMGMKQEGGYLGDEQ